jgi:lactate permease
MSALLAAAPIGLVVLAMIVWRWGAASAGLLGFGATLVIAIAGFGFGTRVYGSVGPAAAAAGAILEAMFTAAAMLWIILPALCIYELQARSGAFETMRRWLAQQGENPQLVTLLVAWFFALFLEGVAGFGTPVALTAPILVGLGFTPVRAVTLALVGHAAGVSFGAVGTPVLPQMAATGLSGLELARPAGLLHAGLGAILVAFLVRLAGDAPPSPREWIYGALATFLFFAPFLAIAWFVGPELPTVGGAILGGIAFALVIRRRALGAEGPKGSNGRAMLHAALPYLTVVALVLASRLVPPFREALQMVVWDWTLFEAFEGRIEPLYHPGTLLLVSFILGGIMQGRSTTDIASAAMCAARRLGPVVVALLAMLGLSRLMDGACLAVLRSVHRRAWHVCHRLGDLVEHPFLGVSGSNRQVPGVTRRHATRRAELRCGGRQYGVPAQYHCRWGHGRSCRARGRNPAHNSDRLPDLRGGGRSSSRVACLNPRLKNDCRNTPVNERSRKHAA